MENITSVQLMGKWIKKMCHTHTIYIYIHTHAQNGILLIQNEILPL